MRIVQEGFRERRFVGGRLARGLVEVGHASATFVAAQSFPQLDRGKVLTKAVDVVGREENATVLAPPAHCNERGLGLNELTECAGVGHAHGGVSVRVIPATSAGTSDR
jgi:hypothetical protein